MEGWNRDGVGCLTSSCAYANRISEFISNSGNNKQMEARVNKLFIISVHTIDK